MKATEFCYWLQGLFELGSPVQLDARQTDLIKRHLAMVFLHDIDPSYPEEEQAGLDAAHSGEPTKIAKPGMRPDHPDVRMRC